MAKVQIKSEKLTPFGGIFSVMEQFDALLAQTIDSSLGLRCTMFGYQYSEILRSLMCVYLCGGSCVEDVTTHLMKHLSLHRILQSSWWQGTHLRWHERNFYKAIMQRLKTHEFGLRAISRIKTVVFKFISVPAKWIKTSRRHVLNIYSDNNAYANLFKTDFG